jgi:hypothetical protein
MYHSYCSFLHILCLWLAENYFVHSHVYMRGHMCLLSLPLQTMHTQYVQSFPPFIYCVQFIYNPYTVCSSFTIHILCAVRLQSIYCVQFIYNPYTPLYISFSFLDGFLATRGNSLCLVHDLTIYISTNETEVISVAIFLTCQLYILMNKCMKQFCQNIIDIFL